MSEYDSVQSDIVTGVIPDYIRLMSEDVSSLEATRQRIQEAVGGTVGVLEALNATVNDIETRSAAALNDSRHATQVSVFRVFTEHFDLLLHVTDVHV